ncbi:hypothetical protein HK405_008511 [Cladochytrium tenue]|nr:hypothetical protein HK405_008511 [Cladochytrium tenue]
MTATTTTASPPQTGDTNTAAAAASLRRRRHPLALLGRAYRALLLAARLLLTLLLFLRDRVRRVAARLACPARHHSAVAADVAVIFAPANDLSRPRPPPHVAIVVAPERLRRGAARRRRVETEEDVKMQLDVEEGNVLLEQLAWLACWCASAGVKSLTLYDDLGAVAASCDTLLPILQRTAATYFSSTDSSTAATDIVARPAITLADSVLSRGPWPAYSAADNDGVNAANPTAHTVAVRAISSASHGPRRLLTLITAAAEDHAVDLATNLSIDGITASLRDEAGDPEFLFVLGDDRLAPLQLHGAIPWQLRLTEFGSLGADDEIHYADFLWGLYAYSRKSHRYGR